MARFRRRRRPLPLASAPSCPSDAGLVDRRLFPPRRLPIAASYSRRLLGSEIVAEASANSFRMAAACSAYRPVWKVRTNPVRRRMADSTTSMFDSSGATPKSW